MLKRVIAFIFLASTAANAPALPSPINLAPDVFGAGFIEAANRQQDQALNSLILSAATLMDESRYQEAAPLIAQADSYLASVGGTKVQRALVTEVKGRYFAGINRHAEAEALLKNAIELKEQVWGLNTVNVIAPLQILTQIYLRQHRLQDAYNVAARAYNLALQLRAKQPVFFASIEDTLGYVFLEFGQAAKAEALFLDVRAIMARAGDEAAIGLADDHLALTYLYLLQYEKARQFAAESLMILRRRGGPELPQVLGAELNLAVIEVEGGIQLAEAEQALRHVLSIYEVALGREDPDTAKLYNNLGWLEVKRKRPQEAAAWFRQSLGIYAKARRAQTFTLTSQDAPGGVAERETARAIRGFLRPPRSSAEMRGW